MLRAPHEPSFSSPRTHHIPRQTVRTDDDDGCSGRSTRYRVREITRGIIISCLFETGASTPTKNGVSAHKFGAFAGAKPATLAASQEANEQAGEKSCVSYINKIECENRNLGVVDVSTNGRQQTIQHGTDRAKPTHTAYDKISDYIPHSNTDQSFGATTLSRQGKASAADTIHVSSLLLLIGGIFVPFPPHSSTTICTCQERRKRRGFVVRRGPCSTPIRRLVFFPASHKPGLSFLDYTRITCCRRQTYNNTHPPAGRGGVAAPSA